MQHHKGFLLATVSGIALAPAAQAADLSYKAPAPVPIAASWEGFYMGLHAGANWQQATTGTTYDAPLTTSTNATGFIGGAQLGYNWQHGNFVYGVEADGSWLTGKGSTQLTSKGKGISNRIKWLATFRGRAGLALGDTMVYATGGLAVGGVENIAIMCAAGCLKSESKTKVGWTIGGGVEHMWDRHWTVGLEGLFVDLGKSTVGEVTDPTASATFHNQAMIGRLKLNYKW